MKKVTIPALIEKKKKGIPITFLTAYDYPMALLEEKAEIDIILVGDSIGMTVFGYENTLPVTMDILIEHTKAVRRGAPNCFLVGDMPFMSYQVSIEEAIRNAGRFMKEAGCDAIKLEGGIDVIDRVEAIVKAGIPVMAHIGLTPQSASLLGGFKAQGKTAESALKIIKDAKELEEAGAFAILLEAIPPQVSKIITERSSVPTLGIGAGPYCDGQVLVVHDVLGMFDAFVPKFVKQYANLNRIILDALKEFKRDVEERKFPEEKHSYSLPEEEYKKLLNLLKDLQ